MLGLGQQPQSAELRGAEFAQLDVVIAGHQDHLDALAQPRQQRAQHAAVRGGPVQPAARGPQIDDVPDEEQAVHLYRLEEVEQQLGPAVSRAQVDVGEKDGAGVYPEVRIRRLTVGQVRIRWPGWCHSAAVP